MTFYELKLFLFQQVEPCKGQHIFFKIYEVCAKALKNASALPAIHAMYVNFSALFSVIVNSYFCFSFLNMYL